MKNTKGIRKIESLKVLITEKKNNLKEQLFKDVTTEIDLPYYLDDDITSFDDLVNNIDNNNGFDIEIIYYYNAMEYLMKNDTSLNESLAIAAELGYTPENLNSEILASLLASQNERINFNDYERTFNDYFEAIEELNTKVERLEEIEEETEEATKIELELLSEEIEELETYLN